MGHKEGEVLQAGMISGSIERAQKKVEENNFGIRKRLLEYDDVMNKQRNVIYGKRRNALFGDRLAIDIDNAFYQVALALVQHAQNGGTYEEFSMNVILVFSLETDITHEELDKNNAETLALRLYEKAIAHYREKKNNIAAQTMPLIKNIRAEQGNHIENVSVPFTDGRKGLQTVVKLDAYLETNGLALMTSLERTITLALIDDAWREHLRAMDDLRHSVQTAGYEQKDPLVIYKIEAYNAFRQMNEQLNRDMVSFLCHAGIPVETNRPAQIQEGRERKTDMSRMRVNKDEIDAAGDDYAANERDYFDPSMPAKQEPVRVEPKIGRNDPCPCGSGKKFKQCHGNA
jgi:preprotein translocase subunit SecA